MALVSIWSHTKLAALLAWSACTALAAAMRAVPTDRFLAFEAAYPRLAALARAARKAAFDLIPFAQAIVAALRGAPSFPVIPPAPPCLVDAAEDPITAKMHAPRGLNSTHKGPVR